VEIPYFSFVKHGWHVCCSDIMFARVAQGLRRLRWNSWVTGSNPTGNKHMCCTDTVTAIVQIAM
jgi:hypothetical protein